MKKIILGMICLAAGCTTLFANNKTHDTTGVSYAALPVLETYVPQEAVAKLKAQYPNLYSITCIKGDGGQVEYCVRKLDNGVMKEEKVNEASLANK